MSLQITDALRKELRPQGRQNKNMYLFRCATEGCPNEFWVEPRRFEKHKGFCLKCVRRNSMLQILPHQRGKILRPYEWLLNRLRHISEKRDVEVDLTYEEFLQFTRVSECHYCGSAISWTKHNMGKTGNGRTNLDRKNNEEGYSTENCVVACIVCNRIKNNYLSYEDMMRLSPILRQILPSKNWVETHKKSRFPGVA